MSYSLKTVIPMYSPNITVCYPYFSTNNCIFYLTHVKEEHPRYKFFIELDHNILHINIHNNRLYVSTTERFYILNFSGKILITLKIRSLKCFTEQIEKENCLLIATESKLDIYTINYDRLRFILITRIDAKNINHVSVHNNILYYTEELKLKTYCFETHEIRNILYSKSNILNFNIVDSDEIVMLTETQFIRKINTTQELKFINFLPNSEKLQQIFQITDKLYSFIYDNEIKFMNFNGSTLEELFTKTFNEKIKKISFIKSEGLLFLLFKEKLLLLSKSMVEIFEFYLPKLNTFNILNNQILIASEKKLFLYENNYQICNYEHDDEIFKIFYSNLIFITVFKNGSVDFYDTKNQISFRKFQLELPIDEIEKHNDLLICSTMNKICIYDLYGKNLISFELQGTEKLKIQKILAYENFIYILTYQNILRYDLTTSSQISFDIKSNTFDINEKYIILSLNNEINILNHNLEFIRSFKYELEGRRRDEKFYNIKTATSISYMNNLIFISGNCNQLKIYYEKYLIDTLLLSKNKDLEGYKKFLGKEKDLNTPILKSDIIKCIKIEKNIKTNEIFLQTQHDIRIYGINELKYEPVELLENITEEDINKFIEENNLQKALIGSLMLNDNEIIKQVVYKLCEAEKNLLENIIRSIDERFILTLENFLQNEILNSDNVNLNYGLLIFIKEVIKRTLNKSRVELWESKLRDFYMKSKKTHIMKSPKV